jgi:hypothetical protein
MSNGRCQGSCLVQRDVAYYHLLRPEYTQPKPSSIRQDCKPPEKESVPSGTIQ